MILKGKKTLSMPVWLPWVLLMLAVSLWWYLSSGASGDKERSKGALLYCDAEDIDTVDGQSVFLSGGNTFSNGGTRSDEEAYSGSHSSKVGGNRLYSMSTTIDSPKPGQIYTASVWRKTIAPLAAYLVIKQSPNKDMYVQSNTTVEEGPDGWQRIEVQMMIPLDGSVTGLSVFPYINTEVHEAYFDDLVVKVKHPLDDLDELDETLHFYLDDKATRKLEAKRTEALAKGILQSSDDDWVKAKMTANDSLEYNVKLRLKGDWTDHLRGEYWSYRVKMPSDKSWNRLMTFSLQDPATRYFLHEWLYHKVLEKEDVITPRYGFVKLSQNDKEPTLYAYEEHFEKQIVEYKNRREGVILKFGEGAMWEERLRARNHGMSNTYYGTMESAEVEVFKESKMKANPKLKEQFDHGRSLLTAYQEGTLPVSEVFDIQRLAKLFALADVLDANHGLIWHNQRYYYNPVTRVLEPIGFDGFTHDGAYPLYKKLFFGEYMTSDAIPQYYSNYQRIFADKAFSRIYIPLMLKYSDKAYLSDILREHEEEIEKYQYLIGVENKGYRFDAPSILKRAAKIANNLRPYDGISIQAFRGMEKGGPLQISAANRHPLPLEVVGYASTPNGKQVPLAEPIWMNSSPIYGPAQYQQIEVPEGTTTLYFRLPGTEEMYTTTVRPWAAPSIATVKYAKDGPLQLPIPEVGQSVSADRVTIKTGTYVVSEPIVIPAGKELVIEAGTSIDLVKGAYILSYSTVQLNGTADNPILINSSDKNSQGFVVQEASERSRVEHTVFTQLNTLSENEWQLTGAVTFYESDVDMKNVTIAYNYCEDALNLVRCKFEIEGLNINHTFADGFDGDFCKGVIRDSYLHHTGNDGLDYSGSTIHVDNVKLEHIGDKGISAGEEATVYIVSADISYAEIGVASKDLSKVTVQDISLSNVGQGFAAYQKKPEFGGGNIYVGKHTATDVRQLTIADEQSSIVFKTKD